MKDKKRCFLRSYVWTKKEINKKQVWKSFGSSQVCGIGLGLVFWSLILWFTQVFSIPFLLNNCISVPVFPRSVVCSWGDQDQHSWSVKSCKVNEILAWGVWCCKESEWALWDSKSPLCGCVICNLWLIT